MMCPMLLDYSKIAFIHLVSQSFSVLLKSKDCLYPRNMNECFHLTEQTAMVPFAQPLMLKINFKKIYEIIVFGAFLNLIFCG